MGVLGGTLLVSGSDKGREFLLQLLKEEDCQPVTPAASGDEARRLITQCDFDLILINAPAAGEKGPSLAVFAVENTTAAVLLLVKAEVADETAAQVEREGVLVLAKPFGRAMFSQTLRLGLAARRRMLGLRNENIQLQKKIEEIRIVDRAKCVLMEVLALSEPQAHRYLEKEAMDRRVTRREVAEQVLRTYEPST